MAWRADTFQPPEPGFQDEWCVRDDDGLHCVARDVKDEATARRLAATPDLLDVCQRLAAWGRGEHHAGGRAQAALADILFANAAALDKATKREETA